MAGENKTTCNDKATVLEERTKQKPGELWKGLSGWQNQIRVSREGEEGKSPTAEMH